MNSMSTVSPATEGALPSAQDCFSEVIQAEAAEARKQSKGELEKKKLLEQFSKPSGVSDEQRLKRATSIIRRAVRSRLTEVEIGRFPNQLCTDRGRAIIQAEFRLGGHLDRPAQGTPRILAEASRATRLQDLCPDRRLAGRNAGRRRHRAELEAGAKINFQTATNLGCSKHEEARHIDRDGFAARTSRSRSG